MVAAVHAVTVTMVRRLWSLLLGEVLRRYGLQQLVVELVRVAVRLGLDPSPRPVRVPTGVVAMGPERRDPGARRRWERVRWREPRLVDKGGYGCVRRVARWLGKRLTATSLLGADRAQRRQTRHHLTRERLVVFDL